MSALILPSRLTQQPQWAASVARSNPLTQALAFLWVGSNPKVEVVTGTQVTTDNTTKAVGTVGRVTNNSASQINTEWARQFVLTSAGDGTGDFTLAVYANPTTGSAVEALLCQKNDAGGTPYAQAGIYANADAAGAFSSGSISFFTFNNNGAGSLGVQATGQLDGQFHWWVATRKSNVYTLYRDGIVISGATTGGGSSQTITQASPTRYMAIGGQGNTTSGAYTRQAALAAGWNRALSASEAAANPWQLFAAPPRRLWLAASSGGTTSGTGSASGTATVSGVGAATANSTASASGTGSAAAIGASNAVATASSAGSSTAAATGATTTSATASSSGSSTASATGAASAATVGSAAGSSTASAANGTTAGNVGSASGTSTASGTGAALVAATGTATGSSTANAATAYMLSAVGTAAGTSSAQASPPSTASAVGTAGGSSTAQAVSPSTAGGADYGNTKKKRRKVIIDGKQYKVTEPELASLLAIKQEEAEQAQEKAAQAVAKVTKPATQTIAENAPDAVLMRRIADDLADEDEMEDLMMMLL